eukprot:Sspe_Gene.43720::Locus_21353_Transcript_1_1_Confidence_1.000_Length_2658::g.43720::m.43720
MTGEKRCDGRHGQKRPTNDAPNATKADDLSSKELQDVVTHAEDERPLQTKRARVVLFDDDNDDDDDDDGDGDCAEGSGGESGLVVKSPSFPTVTDLYSYMWEREMVRVRREQALPREEWTQDSILRKYHFVNVKREHDATTKALRRVTDAKRAEWVAADEEGKRRLAMQTVLNCAVARRYGSLQFITALFHRHNWLNGWGAEEQRLVLETALTLWRKRIPCLSDAYDLVMRNSERGAKTERDVAKVYGKLNRIIAGVWKRCGKVAAVARITRSWERTCEAIAESKYYGGSGFMAKELCQDLLHTFVFPHGCIDQNTWTALGPGARRGLRRLRLDGTDEMDAVAQLRHILQQSETLWQGPPLVLHDIQFALCELDKYCRIANGERGRKRVYAPRPR